MPSRVALIALLVTAPLALAGNWPQWRGPKNDGLSAETGIPAAWGPDKNVVWKAKLPGPGAGTPCVWGDKLFFTAQVGDAIDLMCFGTDGQEKWRKPLGTGSGRFRGDEGNLASASCSTDGERVYAMAGTGVVAAFDFAGQKKWEVDTQAKYGAYKIQFGGHWTPALYQGKLYVALLHRGVQLLVKLDAATGTEEWKAVRASDGKGEAPDVYASPFIWEGQGTALLVVHGNDYTTAHKLTDGSEVWRVTELNPKARYNMAWRAVSSPLVTPDLIVIPSCKNGVTVAIDPAQAKGTIAPGSPAEKWRLPKGTPDVPSPLLVKDVLYLMRENGELTAHDAATGTQLYAQRVTNMRHRANPVHVDGKVIVVGRDGTMPVVKPGREFELLATNKLPDTFTASPAPAGGRLYLRGWEYLWAIGTK